MTAGEKVHFSNIWKHFKTITKHRHQVIYNCYRAGILWQGLRHDLSKYSPTEFWVGAKYYHGYRSPMRENGMLMDIQKPGCITKAEINIILNTGLITVERRNN